MSVFDIMDYVRTTPGNTNPAVVRSMVEGEIRAAKKEASSEILKLKQDGGVGYTEYKEIEVMTETVVTRNGTSNYYYFNFPYIDWSLVDTSVYGYIDGVKYYITHPDSDYSCFWYIYGDIPPSGSFSGNSYYGTLCWTGEGIPPETITVSIKQTYTAIHPINFKYLPEGFGYTEKKVVEFLPETVCERAENSNDYNIPYSGMDENNEYHLYIDGELSFTSYFDRDGLNWSPAGGNSDKFYSYYSMIYYAGDSETAPKTINVRIEEIIIIHHPIADKYIHDLPRRVSLLESGGVVLEEMTIPFEVVSEDGYGVFQTNDPEYIKLFTDTFTPGTGVRLKLDGVEYTCRVEGDDYFYGVFFGNKEMGNMEYSGGIPFICICRHDFIIMGVIGTEETHTISIAIDAPTPAYTYDDKFLGYAHLEAGYHETYVSIPGIDLVPGKTYIVRFDNRYYTSICKDRPGNPSYIGSLDHNTDEPFMLQNSGDSIYGYIDGSATYCSIIEKEGGQRFIESGQQFKTINLDKYGITEMLLQLFTNGGGHDFVSGSMEEFWTEVSTNVMLRLEATYPTNGVKMVFDQPDRIMYKNKAVAISWAYSAYDSSISDEPIHMKVYIHRYTPDGEYHPVAEVFVKLA